MCERGEGFLFLCMPTFDSHTHTRSQKPSHPLSHDTHTRARPYQRTSTSRGLYRRKIRQEAPVRRHTRSHVQTSEHTLTFCLTHPLNAHTHTQRTLCRRGAVPVCVCARDCSQPHHTTAHARAPSLMFKCVCEGAQRC